jgi:hypothetical protein
MPLGVLVYMVGVLVGVTRIDARGARRVGLALAWPLGPLAGVVTIAGLVVASLILFPAVGLTAAAIASLWWLFA